MSVAGFPIFLHFPNFSLLAALTEDLVFVLGRLRHGFGPKRLVFRTFSHHFHHFQGAELASQARPGQARPYVCRRLSNSFSLSQFFSLLAAGAADLVFVLGQPTPGQARLSVGA